MFVVDRHRFPRIALATASLAPAALLLAGCGSDKPPPLTGNVTDARGAHAGSFRPVDANPVDANSAAIPAGMPNTQAPLQ